MRTDPHPGPAADDHDSTRDLSLEMVVLNVFRSGKRIVRIVKAFGFSRWWSDREPESKGGSLSFL